MVGDGQVTMGESVVMKGTAKKVRKIYHDRGRRWVCEEV